MTDRELLELAAKTLGAKRYTAGSQNTGLVFDNWPGEPENYWFADGSKSWNPLTDDGDALRLAVKLSIVIDPYTNYPMGTHFQVMANITDTYTQRTGNGGFSEAHNGDPYAATRRAIVRAAAEVGRNIEIER